MALIVGGISIGTFNLPTSVAAYSPIALISMALTTVGALALVLLSAALSRRLPTNDGPYAYARIAFSNHVGVRERLVVPDPPRGPLATFDASSHYARADNSRPVAAKMALAIAEATAISDVSPAPAEGRSGQS